MILFSCYENNFVGIELMLYFANKYFIMLISINDYAKKHGVSPQAINYQIKIGNIICRVKYGKRLVNASKTYNPRKDANR